MIALTIAPLHTPLQPQTSASSAIASARDLALVAGVAEIRLAEHQPVADLGDAAAFAQQLEVPGAVDGVAVEHAADQLVAA